MRRDSHYDRTERVADAIKRLVAEALLTEMSDPRLSGAQITHVRMTKDLRIARIYYHLFQAADAERKNAARGFKSAAGYIRRKIGEELSLKFTPEVEFFYDDSIDLSDRIDELMQGIKKGG